MIFNSASRERVREAERLWLAKFVLRILTFLLVTIGIILVSVALSTTSTNHIYDFFLLPWLLIPVRGTLDSWRPQGADGFRCSWAYLGRGI